MDLYHTEEHEKESTLIDNLKKVQTWLLEFHTTKLNTSMTEAKEEELVALLRKNIDLFAWTPYDMSGIYT